jgi:hypothetical protein
MILQNFLIFTTNLNVRDNYNTDTVIDNSLRPILLVTKIDVPRHKI